MQKCCLWVGLLAVGAVTVARAAPFEETLAADPHGEVNVSNVSGAIDIAGWDKPQLSVKADVSGSQKVLVTNERGHISVRVEGHESHGIRLFGAGSGGSVRLQVWLPRTSELNVTAVSADVTSKGMLGAQRLHSVSGEITADVGGADNEVKSVSGDIKLTGNAQPGHFRLDSVSGDVHLGNAAGDLDATTISGDLSAELSPANTVHLHTTSGEITLTGKVGNGAMIEAQTVSGDVKLHGTAPDGYEYEARSFSGDIDDCFDKSAERNSQYGPGKHLNGTLGQGGAKLRVNTLSGDISLCNR
jgi:Putative adhesin